MDQLFGKKKMCRRTADGSKRLRDKKGRFCKKSTAKVVKSAKMKKMAKRSRSRSRSRSRK